MHKHISRNPADERQYKPPFIIPKRDIRFHHPRNLPVDPDEGIDCECDIVCRGTKYLAIALPVLCSVILPPLMIYIGIAYSHCDTIFPVWLIIGAILWYIEIPLVIWNGKENGFSNLKEASNKLAFLCVLFFSLVILGWWGFGIGRILGPAKTIRHSKDLGIYDDPVLMNDEECNL